MRLRKISPWNFSNLLCLGEQDMPVIVSDAHSCFPALCLYINICVIKVTLTWLSVPLWMVWITAHAYLTWCAFECSFSFSWLPVVRMHNYYYVRNFSMSCMFSNFFFNLPSWIWLLYLKIFCPSDIIFYWLFQSIVFIVKRNLFLCPKVCLFLFNSWIFV